MYVYFLIHCNRTLNSTFKLFILPIITYCCEPLITAFGSVTELLDKAQNQALRIITGAVKTTPIDAMLVLTENKPLNNIFQEKTLLLWEKITRLPDCLSLLSDLALDTRRCLKTQRSFVKGVLELKQLLDVNLNPEPLVQSLDPTIDKGFRICTELKQAVSKKDQDTSQF